jgi:hypothetical protein
MKKRYSVIALIVVAVFALASCKAKEEPKKAVVKGNMKSITIKKGDIKSGPILPNFSLKDPAGKVHTNSAVVKGGAVFVVTAPTLSNSSAQNGWSKYLVKGMAKGAKLVFLEDMEPSSFKDVALHDMKKEFVENQPPLLLIDDTGKLREEMGAERNKTEIFVFNDKGALIYKDNSKPSADAAKIIWSKLR